MSFNDKILAMKIITYCSDYLLLEPVVYWCKMSFNRLDLIVLWSNHMLIKEYNMAWLAVSVCQVFLLTMFSQVSARTKIIKLNPDLSFVQLIYESI